MLSPESLSSVRMDKACQEELSMDVYSKHIDTSKYGFKKYVQYHRSMVNGFLIMFGWGL